jgi:hypothetical protein
VGSGRRALWARASTTRLLGFGHREFVFDLFREHHEVVISARQQKTNTFSSQD